MEGNARDQLQPRTGNEMGKNEATLQLSSVELLWMLRQAAGLKGAAGAWLQWA